MFLVLVIKGHLIFMFVVYLLNTRLSQVDTCLQQRKFQIKLKQKGLTNLLTATTHGDTKLQILEAKQVAHRCAQCRSSSFCDANYVQLHQFICFFDNLDSVESEIMLHEQYLDLHKFCSSLQHYQFWLKQVIKTRIKQTQFATMINFLS